MKYPKFYDEIEDIILKDELSAFLGASKEGIIDISYLDIVKMAGHSCATIAGAYLMAQKGLKELFGTELPKRGEIKVELKGTLDDNTGAIALVLSNITGATSDSGFMGIQGKYNRRGLLFYGVNIKSNARFTRLDTNKSVEVNYMPMKVVTPGEIIQSALGPNATKENKKTFPERWQKMVKTVFDNADKVIEIR
ncbi:MAG: hypothetical protein ABFS35_07905 [Bacteroidota bacterium]